MNEINWQKVASDNGLSVDEFKKEIFTVACAIATESIDNNADGNDALKFTCSDQISKVEMIVRRI